MKLVTALAIPLSGTLAALAAFAPVTADDPLKISLEQVRESRAIDLRPVDERGGMTMSGEPGLELQLRAALPEGARVLSITQPAKVDAKDSVGTDLSKIPENMWGKVEHLSAPSSFDESVFRLALGLPSRKAESFSVNCDASVTIYSGVEPFDVEQSDAWIKLTHPSFAAIGAEFRFKMDEEVCQLRVRPTAAKDLIEAIMPAVEGAEPGGYSVSYNDEFASFDVDPRPEPKQKLRIFVRAGVKSIPLHIEVKDQPLP